MAIKFNPLIFSGLDFTGSAAASTSIGGAVTGGTDKSVLFISPTGILAQDNANFNYDSATHALTITGIFSASNVSGTNTGDVTLAAFGSTPSANAASLSGQVLTLQPADATNPGGVSITTQTFAGNKTFGGTVTIAQLIDNGLTANTVPYADGSKQLISSSVTPTELGYLSGVTSSIQTQFTALTTTVIRKDGSVTYTANQPMGGFKLTGLAAGTTAGDSVRYEQVILANGTNPFTANQSLGSNKLTNVTDPTAAQDAATKNYVDNAVSGLSWKTAVTSASVANVTISSAPSTLDGYTLVSGDRVLLKNQTAPAENGIYIFNGAGSALTRSTDADTWNELIAATVYVESGSVNSGSKYVSTTVAGGTIGVTAVNFVVFSGAGTVTGTGTANYVAYWNSTSNLTAEQFLSASRGGLATDASAFTGVVKASAGVFSASSIVNADINASAAIDLTKLAALTTHNRALQSDNSGFITESSVTSTELGYLSGVTSAIQTQLNNKATIALDNLASTAVNVSIVPGTTNSINLGSTTKAWAATYSRIYSSDDTVTINTQNNGAGFSKDITINSGTGTTGTGALNINSGNGSGGASGAVTLASGTSTSNTSGIVTVQTGTASASSSGNLLLKTGGASVNNDSGLITIQTGATSGSGVRGVVNISGSQINNAGNTVVTGSIKTDTSLIIEDPGAGTNTITIQAPTLAAGYTLTLPVDDGNANQVLQTNGSGVLTWATVSTPTTGDISDTQFTAADNQSSPANVTGFTFANASVRSFTAQVSIVRSTTYAAYTLRGIQKGASWDMAQDFNGDTTGLTFSITAAGQVQYTSTSTGSTANVHFRATVTAV